MEIRNDTLALTNRPNAQVLVEVDYWLEVTAAEREMTDAYVKARGPGSWLWRDRFCLYGIDVGYPRTLLVHINGTPIVFLPWNPSLSLHVERSFTFSRRYVDEDAGFGTDEIQCDIEVVPDFDTNRWYRKVRTNQVSLPGGAY